MRASSRVPSGSPLQRISGARSSPSPVCRTGISPWCPNAGLSSLRSPMLTATHPLYPLVEAQNRLFRARQTQSAAEFGSGASMVETAASGLGAAADDTRRRTRRWPVSLERRGRGAPLEVGLWLGAPDRLASQPRRALPGPARGVCNGRRHVAAPSRAASGWPRSGLRCGHRHPLASTAPTRARAGVPLDATCATATPSTASPRRLVHGRVTLKAGLGRPPRCCGRRCRC